jgi:hypothetical protein
MRLFEAKSKKKKSFKKYLIDEWVYNISGTVYHGSPACGLESILTEGIYGKEHGEVSEYNTFSTSFNAEVLRMFSDGDGYMGVSFNVKNAKILVMNDLIAELATAEVGSGLSFDNDEEEMNELVDEYDIPKNRRGNHSLPFGYISDLGVDGFMYEYVHKKMLFGSFDTRDESELCFLGNGIARLDKIMESIIIENDEYNPKDPSERMEALNIIRNICKKS